MLCEWKEDVNGEATTCCPSLTLKMTRRFLPSELVLARPLVLSLAAKRFHNSRRRKGMADHSEPAQGEEREVSSSGLLLSVDPLPGTAGYKLSADDNKDAGSDSSDVAGDDSDTSDADGSDSSDTDGTDYGDTDGTDDEESDADGTDASDADGTDTGADADGTDPLGI